MKGKLTKIMLTLCCAILFLSGAMFIVPQKADAVYATGEIDYTAITSSTAIGSAISFGGKTWNLLSYDDTNKRALLFCSEIVEKMAFGTSNAYEGSAVQAYLNGTFYNSLTDKDKILPISINATDDGTDVTTYSVGTNYCFLLSYTDVYGANASTALDTDEERVKTYYGNPDCWWLRSPGIMNCLYILLTPLLMEMLVYMKI